MNYRKWLYFSLVSLRGQQLGLHYNQFLTEYHSGIPRDTTSNLLCDLLDHCWRSVPYYAGIMQNIEDSYYTDPVSYLRKLPMLTKDDLRSNFNNLSSTDNNKRHCYQNSTGGSTGDTAKFIQDWEYSAKAGAISMLFSTLVGKEFGEKEVVLWGSMHDIEGTTESVAARMVNLIGNQKFLGVFCLDDQTIRDHIEIINRSKPKLIVAYAEAIFEIAKFAQRERIKIEPVPNIITSAGTLYPLMRDKIEQVFQSRVYNRYGSREVGDIACELPGHTGLWVAPWGNYIEIVDSTGRPVHPGEEGDLLITSLVNYAMPLIRYQIGDRGILMPQAKSQNGYPVQMLKEITGRATDMLIDDQGNLINGMLFLPLLAYKDWIKKYQVVQKNRQLIVIKIVLWGNQPGAEELERIKNNARRVIKANCEIEFEFVDELDVSPSGKHRYVISEISNPSVQSH